MDFWNDKNGFDKWKEDQKNFDWKNAPKIEYNPNGKSNGKSNGKPNDKTKGKNGLEKASNIIGAAQKVVDRLEDKGLSYSPSATNTVSGEGNTTSGTAEGGIDYWRSHKSENGDPNDNEED